MNQEMSGSSNLAESIRSALRQTPKTGPVSEQELRELASSARKVNEEALDFLSNLPAVQVEREYLTLQLIRAAFDHARGLLFLIEANPRDMGAPALALHRSQIDNFLRGVFLGFLASEEQIEDFLQNDFGIREKNHNGKWQNIGTVALAQHVELFINGLSDSPLEDPEKFSSMVEKWWSPLCGFVHGGRAVRALYRDGQGEIGSDIPIDALVQCVSNCFVVTNFGFFVVIAHIHKLEVIPLDSSLNKSLESFVELQETIKVKQLRSEKSNLLKPA